jgi:hypothetical protein
MFQIDLNLLKTEEFKEKFYVMSHLVGKDSELCYLVKPKKGMFTWTQDLLYFRSSVYNSNGELISASYPKFFNLDECTSIYPFDGVLDGANLIEKIDGSTLIVSKYKGEVIVRTRGSINAEELMNNGSEIEYFRNKYGFFFRFMESTSMDDTYSMSFIFEWVSPKNKIVISYPEPDLYLTGCINHKDYSLSNQADLDILADIYGFKRPHRHKFNTLQELISNVEQFDKDHEGVCLYYDSDQHIRKVKGLAYLKLHSFKSQCTLNKLLDFYEEWNNPKQVEFEELIKKNFDHECLLGAKTLIEILYECVYRVEHYKNLVNKFVNDYYAYPQKDFALKIKEEFSWNPILCGLGFAMKKGNKIGKFNRSLLEDTLRSKTKEEGISHNNMTLLGK